MAKSLRHCATALPDFRDFSCLEMVCRVADLFRGLQVDGDELTYASFAHGNAKKTVHFCHGQAVVRHYEKTA